MGTTISAYLSMSVVLSAFSLFTAYQFLSPGKLVFTPERKMRPSPSCVYQRLCASMMEMIAWSFFFAYCVSNFECWFFIFKRPWQSLNSKLQYNTCRRKIRQFSALGCLIFWPHVYHIPPRGWPHIAVDVFLLCAISFCSPFSCFSSLPAEWFSSAFTAWKQDHMAIIRYLYLTTSLTINRTGVHGDKSAREYEKAVFA